MKEQERNIELWVTEKVKCDLCGRIWIAVYIYTTEKLECPNCHHMVYFESIPLE